MNDLDSLKFQLEVERTNYLRNAEELMRQRDEALLSAARHEHIGRDWMVRTEDAEAELAREKARADKAERDLGECLAATNEVLKDALEQGKEADAPNQALVKAVRTAYRLGAEEMRTSAVALATKELELAENAGRDACSSHKQDAYWAARAAQAKTLEKWISSILLPGDAS